MPKISRRLLQFSRPLAVCLVGTLAWAILRVTWLRWMDPFVDFGRELYLPWRILAGEHPGRDLVHLYGPFSVYFNAGLFAVFGVAIRTLVLANLVIFAAILGGLFVVTRRSFGFLPAVIAVAVAIPVFGFPHYAGINNYTYAAPYSHEATHGMLFLLFTLIWLGGRNGFVQRPASGFVTGVLLGLGCLTKTEYVLVAAVLWFACLARLVADGSLRAGTWRWAAWTAAGGGTVWSVAWLALTTALPAMDAARLATNAVTAPFSYRVLSQSPLGLRLLGAEWLGENLFRMAWVGLGTLAGLGLLAWSARKVAAAFSTFGQRVFLLGVMGATVTGILILPWHLCATAFPGLLVGGMAWLLRRWVVGPNPGIRVSPRLWNQLLFFLAACGMLTRMAFDPTVSHYGFFQALLAGAWACGFLIGEWPRFAGATRELRLGLAWAMIGLLGGGSAVLWQRSLQYYRQKETAVGTGADRMLGYRPEVYGLPRAWEQVRGIIAANTAPDSTLLVVPEGISLNYWTRRKHPLRILDLLPATLELNGRDVLSDLVASPPDTVVLVSRDVTEFGYRAYGEDARSGKAILEWIARNYTAEIKAGEYPFTPGKVGLWVLRRNRPE